MYGVVRDEWREVFFGTDDRKCREKERRRDGALGGPWRGQGPDQEALRWGPGRERQGETGTDRERRA
jgi:hypothetical protein